jgi:hypothetical protein
MSNVLRSRPLSGSHEIDWGIYNPKERRGIAKPAVFVIDRDRIVK